MKRKLLLLLLILPMMANAYDFECDGIFYNILSEPDYPEEIGTCEVTYEYEGATYSGYIEIPEEVSSSSWGGNNYKVVGIGNNAFYGCQLDGITLPSTIISIGENAFGSCKGISNLTIPQYIKYIGDDAFHDSDLAGSIYIPNTCKYIGESAFGYSKITGVTKQSLISWSNPEKDFCTIKGGAFCFCENLQYVNLNAVDCILDFNPFNGCNKLTSIEGSGVHTNKEGTKGNLVVDGCLYVFTEADDKNQLELLCCPGGKESFTSPNNTTAYGIKNVLISISKGAFMGCTKMTFLDIPPTVTQIGDYAIMFTYTTDYTYRRVNIPESVEELGYSPFGMYSYNLDIYLYNTTIKDITSMTGGKHGTIHIPQGTLSSFNVEHVSQIFDVVDDIIIVPVVPTDITVEIDGIYYYLSSSDGENTASVRSNPNKYTGNITIPESVVYEGFTYSVTSIEGSAFKDCNGLTAITIPNSVTSIAPYSFYGCKALINITLPNSLNAVPQNAFANCIKLTSIIIPNSVKGIGEKAFYECANLTSVTLGSGVSTVGRCAFWKCNLNSLHIPRNVTSIVREAFSYNGNLTTITVDENNPIYDSRNNCNCIIETSSNTVIRGGKDSTIPQSVTSIGFCAFNGCSTLLTINIPNSVIKIEGSAFSDCSNLSSVVIPNSVESIGNMAFYNCSKLEDVYCYAEVIPSTSSSAFLFNTSRATLHVPKISIESYRTTAPWSSFGTIVPLTYTLTYIVDGEVYKSYDIEAGATITSEPAPTKEGYTFSGWSEIPATMPTHDVIVTGTFTVNNYTLTYIVDGQVYKTYAVAYGSAISPEPIPTKEGYTFSGWSYIPETMPATDVTVMGTFTINSYTLTYKVDGQTYKTYTVTYGTTITPEPAPTKEGYTFSGWSTIPATMPANNVTVTGTFTPNNYTLTYKVDGHVYKTYTVACGSSITPEPAPTKEGYTFSGWNGLPTTMPAHDVTVTGSFTINSYKLTYKVDGQVYKTYTIEYGAAITPEPEPTKEGYTFSGWSTIPATMPAHDVTVTGTFTKIIIKCATPTISYVNGKLRFTCETEGAVCHSTITDTDINSYIGNEVDLTVTYHISVYATKEDYDDSEVATGTLCWIDQQPSTEGIIAEDAVTEVKALPVLIQTQGGTITVQVANEGTEIYVYSVNGMNHGSAIATNGFATINTSLQPGATAIVKIGEKSIKVLIK